MTNTWQVDVEVSTHDLLKVGVLAVAHCRFGDPDCRFCDRFIRVEIPADVVDNDTDARCLAAQLAHTATGMMPTSTDLVSWPVTGLDDTSDLDNPHHLS